MCMLCHRCLAVYQAHPVNIRHHRHHPWHLCPPSILSTPSTHLPQSSAHHLTLQCPQACQRPLWMHLDNDRHHLSCLQGLPMVLLGPSFMLARWSCNVLHALTLVFVIWPWSQVASASSESSMWRTAPFLLPSWQFPLAPKVHIILNGGHSYTIVDTNTIIPPAIHIPRTFLDLSH